MTNPQIDTKQASLDEARAIAERITAYLSNGGLFNPELMDHQAVSTLFLACRDALAAKDAELAEVKASLRMISDHVRQLIPADQNPEQADNVFGVIGYMVSERSRAERAEAQLAEANRALEPFVRLAANYENNLGSDWVGYRGAVYVSDLRAARRAREAQKDNTHG